MSLQNIYFTYIPNLEVRDGEIRMINQTFVDDIFIFFPLLQDENQIFDWGKN